jgi:hypothetical protein
VCVPSNGQAEWHPTAGTDYLKPLEFIGILGAVKSVVKMTLADAIYATAGFFIRNPAPLPELFPVLRVGLPVHKSPEGLGNPPGVLGDQVVVVVARVDPPVAVGGQHFPD